MQRIPLSPILCLLVLTASAYADPALVKKVEPSVVFIKTDKALGSGFIVSEDKVVTNYHVIRGASKVDITFSGEDSPTFTSKGYHLIDEKRDIAVLSLKLTPGATADYMKPVKLAAKHPAKGEDVLAIGNPIGLDFSVSEGIVSAVRKAGSPDDINLKNYEGEWIQHTAAISGGNSGGPLFSMDGEVVGMNTLSFVVNNAQNLNFAISALDIKNILSKAAARPVKNYEPGDIPFVDNNSTVTISDEELKKAKEILSEQIKFLLDRKWLQVMRRPEFKIRKIGGPVQCFVGTPLLRNSQHLIYYLCYADLSGLVRSPPSFAIPQNFATNGREGIKEGEVCCTWGRVLKIYDTGILYSTDKGTLYTPLTNKQVAAVVARGSRSPTGKIIRLLIGLVSEPMTINTAEGKVAAMTFWDLEQIISEQWIQEQFEEQFANSLKGIKANEYDALFKLADARIKYNFKSKNGEFSLEAYAVNVNNSRVELLPIKESNQDLLEVKRTELSRQTNQWLDEQEEYINSLGKSIKSKMKK